MQLTLSYGSGEEIDRSASDIGISITQSISKCGDDLSIKYLVSEHLCKYFSMNTPSKKFSAP